VRVGVQLPGMQFSQARWKRSRLKLEHYYRLSDKEGSRGSEKPLLEL
jgi:hypothetical protein